LFKVWINKQISQPVPVELDDHNLLIFNLFDKNNKSNVKTDVEQLWRRFGLQSLSYDVEDLLIIGMSLFSADKRIPRSYALDNWTRDITLHIPVLELEKWNSVKTDMENMFRFLSGDNWVLEFRKTDLRFRVNKKNSSYKLSQRENFETVSLFSGGLDSFCGAITLLENQKKCCFLGFREYNMLSGRQRELFGALSTAYPSVPKDLVLFNVNPFAPVNRAGEKLNIGAESSTRSRSFLFLSGAIAVASIINPCASVNIPENGFIGVNVPLTESRNGSCSTRTTHPNFLKTFNQILRKLGLEHQIINFYWNKSKGQIVSEHKDKPVFEQNAYKTLSCSHPSLSRYDKITPPCNCGYCYPCLVRRASLRTAGNDTTPYNDIYKLSMDFILRYNDLLGRASDLKAVLLSLKRYITHKDDKEFIRLLLLRNGALTFEELTAYEMVYHESMNELLQMIKYEDAINHGGLLNYIAIEGAMT